MRSKCPKPSTMTAAAFSALPRSPLLPPSSALSARRRPEPNRPAPVEDFRHNSDLFGEGARNAEAQSQFQAAFKRGFQTRDAEMDLGRLLGDLD